MPDFEIQQCPKTVYNVITHIRATLVAERKERKYPYKRPLTNLQGKFCEVADCLITKKYGYSEAIDINNEYGIPQYWHKMRFKTEDDYLMFLLKWS